MDPSGIALVTDGSCYTGDRIGGWAWVAFDTSDNERASSGWGTNTTISRMELYAIADGLDTLHSAYGPCNVLVLSDSQFAVMGFNDPTRRRTKHHDLWDWAEEAARVHENVTFEHVKGHNGHHYNSLADKLAGKARKEGQKANARSNAS